jgi:ATP-dependent Lhr-like helicase
VNVEEDAYAMEAIPVWEGEIIPVPFEVAQEVGRIKRLIAEALTSNKSPLKLLSEYHLDQYAMKAVIECIGKQLDEGFEVASDKNIVIEWFDGGDGYRYVALHTHIGDRGVETLASILSALISARIGAIVEYVKDAYKILFYSKSPKFDGYIVADTLTGLKPNDVDTLLGEVLPYKRYFLWRLWVVARRFGVVERDAGYSLSAARKLSQIFMGTPLYREAAREVLRDVLDIEACRAFLEKLSNGYLRIKVSSNNGLSPMSRISREIYPVADSYTGVGIVDMVKARIDSTKVKLVCMGGADWEATFKVLDVTDPIVCPKCGSKRIAVVKPDDFQALKLARMAIDGKLRSMEDIQAYKRYASIAELVRMYGRRAVAALAGIGIGPATAKRILRNLYLSEEEFYRAIAEAERMYVKTRPYWD